LDASELCAVAQDAGRADRKAAARATTEPKERATVGFLFAYDAQRSECIEDLAGYVESVLPTNQPPSAPPNTTNERCAQRSLSVICSVSQVDQLL
jgi:hypothetical protein